MSKLVTVLVLAGLGWFVWREFKQDLQEKTAALENTRSLTESARKKQTTSSSFSCDGRTYCSQMTSCAEAKYFLANCPGVKMDNEGHGDGIPCERQWCH
jgi:hypothetical protein